MTGIRTALAGICFVVALQATVAAAEAADTIYSGGDRQSYLLLPLIPPKA